MSELPPNIVAFNALAGLVFVKLFEAHPHRTDLVASDFFEPDSEIPSLDHSVLEGRRRLFVSTVKWLEEEGYIRFKQGPGFQTYDPTFSLSCLSERGLRTLTNPLASLTAKEDKRSLGEKLLAVTRSTISKGGGTLAMEAGKLEIAHLIQGLF